MMRFQTLFLSMLLALVFGSGCTSLPTAPGAAGVAGAAAQPMTLPRYLGFTTVLSTTQRTLYRTRVRLARHIPVLEPQPAAAAPMGLADPQAAQSPAPAVAAAAGVQAAEASAPGKIAALNYLSRIDCSQHPQVEEAILASLNDPVDSVRIAALQAVINGLQRCGRHVDCNCNSGCAGGCCTPAIHARLVAMASQQNSQGCWCESNPTARRLARVALTNCNPSPAAVDPQPTELPSPEIIEAVTK